MGARAFNRRLPHQLAWAALVPGAVACVLSLALAACKAWRFPAPRSGGRLLRLSNLATTPASAGAALPAKGARRDAGPPAPVLGRP